MPSTGSCGRDDAVSKEDDDSASTTSADSTDTCEKLIEFRSIRDDNDLEEAIEFSWPGVNRTVRLSTTLEPDDLAPLFAGAQWAGTRVWHAAIRAAQFLAESYSESISGGASLIELGCGLGVPGMIVHMLGGNVLLSDQESIMSQLRKNVRANFPSTAIDNEPILDAPVDMIRGKCSIQARPLTWSRSCVQPLLESTSYASTGFDFVLNCDCVYEPLYGRSWELLVEVIDECLRVNPKCIVLTSVERRTADGIDEFLSAMNRSEHVGSVENVSVDEKHNIELYITRGV